MTLAVVPGLGKRKSYARIPLLLETPNLIQIQQGSYRGVGSPSMDGGLKELFDEISPIKDFAGTRYELYFPSFGFGQKAEMPGFKDDKEVWEHMWAAAKYSEKECYERDATYAVPLKGKVRLGRQARGEGKEEDVFMGDFPLMTAKGTFIVNGAERVVVSQLVRSPGVYFTTEED